nr:hypothetical protein [uncultured Blautia sp.]
MTASWACNYLQNAAATTYKKFLQFYAKRSCKKQYSNKKNLTSKEYAKWKEQAKQERDRALTAYNKSPSDSIVNNFKRFLENK